MEIRRDDLTGVEVQQLIREHLEHMASLSPPESTHALNVDKLRQPNIIFWSAWKDGELLGIGALKELGDGLVEVKSMRTAASHHRKGVARQMLQHIVDEARQRGYRRISLETGARKYDAFHPAHRLYESFGFRECGPFDSYIEDPNSLFMTLDLQPPGR